MTKETVLVIKNKHIQDCGKPPSFESDRSYYTSYFEDGCGDQFILRYSWEKKEGLLYCADLSWEKPVRFKKFDEIPGKLVIDKATRFWLMGCQTVVEKKQSV